MEIKVNCHSSICIKYNNIIIYIDPYKIDKNYNDANYIFITHNHYDHLSLDDINRVSKDNTKYIIPNNDIDKLNSDNVLGVIPNEDYELDDFKFSTIPSYNTNKPFHKKEYNWVGYILYLDKTIYIAGDTDITEENKSVLCDIAMIPIGGTYTMDYKEAAELINIIKPKKVIPIHYGTIVGSLEDGNKFADLVNNDIEVELPY